MLVLSRKRHEEIVITCGNERIIVTIAEIRGDNIRLGFTASTFVRIDRAEVDKARQEERDADGIPPKNIQL